MSTFPLHSCQIYSLIWVMHKYGVNNYILSFSYFYIIFRINENQVSYLFQLRMTIYKHIYVFFLSWWVIIYICFPQYNCFKLIGSHLCLMFTMSPSGITALRESRRLRESWRLRESRRLHSLYILGLYTIWR